MKLLVTGGTGFIGSHTVVELLEHGYEVVIVDNLSNSSESVLDDIFAITGIRPDFYRADIYWECRHFSALWEKLTRSQVKRATITVSLANLCCASFTFVFVKRVRNAVVALPYYYKLLWQHLSVSNVEIFWFN